MKRSFLITLVLSLVTLYSVAQETEKATEPHPVSIDDLLSFRTVGDPQISPDGKWILYVVTAPDLKKNDRDSDIYRVPFEGGEPVRMTTSPKADSSPRWSPDGQTIAFLSARDGTMQIYTMHAFGGEAEKLTDHGEPISGFAWRPDGKAILFASAVPKSEEEKERVATVVDEDLRPRHLWLHVLASKESEQLTSGEMSVRSFDCSPDGKAVVFSAGERAQAFDMFYRTDIYIVEIGNGEPRPLHQNEGVDLSPVFSPCGKWVAFISRDDELHPVGHRSLALLELSSGEIRMLAEDFSPQIIGDIEWTSNLGIVFHTYDRVARRFYCADPGSGSITLFTEGDYVYSALDINAESNRLAFIREDPLTPADLYAAELDSDGIGEPRKLTEVNPQVGNWKLGCTEVITWTAPDGVEVEGLLVYPVDYESGRRYPLMVFAHGGPADAFLLEFSANWYSNHYNTAQYFAGLGWAMLMPNPRGSIGYGDKFERGNINDWGGGDYQDIMSGVDKVIEMGVADPEKLAMRGWSYGGYMTAWIVTQTDRFKAAAVGAGLTNMVSMYGTTDLFGVLEYHFGGHIYGERKQLYLERSALTHVKNVVTPTLIIQGRMDQRVPMGQAQEFYRALKTLGVPTKLIIYPNMGHGPFGIRERRDILQRWTSWFSKYVLGEEVTFDSASESEETESASKER